MPEHAPLEDEMAQLWDDANLLILACPLNLNSATAIEQKLRDCAARARAANRSFGARQLERMADDMAARIKAART